MNAFFKNKNLLIWVPFLVFLVLFFILKFDGLYGQDAYEYLRYSKAIKNFVLINQNPGDYFWPLYYPIFGVLFSFILQDIGLSLLIVSLVSLIVASLYLYKIIILLFKKSDFIGIYILLLFTLSPYIIKNSMLVMSDMLTLCFIVLTVFHFIKYSQNNKTINFYCITLFAVFAFLTRYASAVILIPFVIISSFQFLKQLKNYKHILVILFIIAILFVPHILVRYHNPTSFLSNQWLQSWNLTNLVKRSFTTVDGTSYNFFPNIIYAFSNFFHPRYLFLGILFIPFLFKNKFNFEFKKTIFVSIIFYALFLAGIPFQNNRFLLLSFPLIIILIFPIFNYFIHLKSIKNLIKTGLIIVFILQSVLIFKAFKNTLERNKFEKTIAILLKPYQKNTLYSFDIDIALKGRNLDFNYKNLWENRYFNMNEDDLLLFHPTKFTQQWQGKNPILNYNYFKKNYRLTIIKELPEGWLLYKITSK